MQRHVVGLLLLGLFGPLGVRFVQAAPVQSVSAPPPPIGQKVCSLADQLQTLRVGLLRGSPSLKKFLRRHLRERAPAIPEAELRAAFEREHDPAMIEELSGALAARMARLGEPEALRAPLSRAMSDSDPAARAAAVRGLRGTGSVEAMAKLGAVDYTRLIRDPAPLVRQAVVQNLLSESAEVYFGHDRAVSEQAIAVALAARSGPAADPALAAKLLSEVSTESVGSQVVAELLSLLDGPAEPSLAALRASIVTALGGVPSAESARVVTRLTDLYRQDESREVRRAVLQALVRLEMARAVPLLDALRSVDTGLTAEIDAWQRAIHSGLQEWTLLLREKQRLSPETPQPH